MWEETGVWEMKRGDIIPEPGCGDGEEEARLSETEAEASPEDLADGRAWSGFVTLVM